MMAPSASMRSAAHGPLRAALIPPLRGDYRDYSRRPASTGGAAGNTAARHRTPAGNIMSSATQFEARLPRWRCRDRQHNGVLIASEGTILDLERLTEPELDALDHFAEAAAMP
jgi:hypothetical protein